MNRANPQTQELAERLVASEVLGKQSSEATTLAALCVLEKLRPSLASLMGSTGFRALLSRALAVANADDAWLRTVHVEADGSLAGFDGSELPDSAEDITKGIVVLVSQVLGLLVTFVGENATLRMVQDVWPQFPITDVRIGKEVGSAPRLPSIVRKISL